jgi:PAS domain S-box-containing protein
MSQGSTRGSATKPAVALSGSTLDSLFRTFVETVSDYAIFVLDPEGRVVSWNRGAERLKGYRAAEILGEHFSRFYPPEALEKNRPGELLATATEVGRVEDEGWRVRKDGTRFWANVVITALRDPSGELVGYVKITRDLTDRRRSEERARYAEERFRALIEGVTDYAIFMLDPQGIVTSWNTGAERIKGYSADEIIGRHFSLFYPKEALDRDWPAQELREAERQGRFEDEGWRIRKDGTRFWANVVITAMRNADGSLRGFSKITRDLTERREHEERLRRSEERFRLLVESVEDYSICMLDTDGRVTSWNAGAQRMTGYAADEILGAPIEQFYPADDVQTGRPQLELRDAILYRRGLEIGWRMRKDGTRFWAEVLTTALRDADGRHIGFAQIMRDLSERKRMEAMEEQGRRVTEFLAMLAHELRNPLAPIRNAVSILALTRDVSPEVAWCREVIERQAGHLSRLVDDLLDVSRVTRGKLHINGEPMDVNVAVQRAVEAARPLIERRRQSLEVRVGATPIVVNGDLTRLTQVVLNLLNNAAKYTHEGGSIVVAVETEGQDAVVSVSDNGLGIPPDLLERVFDLFAQGERTLDRAEGGLGIGLTLARRIVLLHGGSIRAESEGAGKGSKFSVRLPQLNLSLPAFEPPEVALPRSVQKRSILVVDDNADSAASIAMFLGMLGHEVTTAASGPEALHHVERARPEIILLDIGLPGFDGYEVARRIRAKPEGQGIRVYAMTGYGQEEDRRRSALAGFDGHLVKPVAPSELAQLIEAGPSGVQA